MSGGSESGAVNNVPLCNVINRKPLSLMQEGILRILPASNAKAVPTGTVLEGLGLLDPTNAERAAVSRSLLRLWHRGLILRWDPELRIQGSGRRWTRA